MKRVKERWYAKHPEHATASMQNLRDNASRFKKRARDMNLMLVRKRTEINRHYENESQVETKQQENPINGMQLEASKESAEKDEDQSYQSKLKLKMKNLENYSLAGFTIWFVAICQNWKPERNYINMYCQKRSRGVQTGL